MRTAAIALAISGFALTIGAVSGARAEPTSAQLQQASEHFQRGKRAFDAGRYADAAEAFERAYQTVPDAGTAFNAAVAWENAPELARAGDAYVLALEGGGLDASRAADATRALEAIEKQLPRVTLRTSSPARVTLAYRTGDAPLVVHPKPGTYEAVVEFPNGTRQTREIEVARMPLVIHVDAPAAVPPPRARTVARPEEGSEDVGLASRVIGFVSLGVGASLGGAAIGLGTKALDARDAFDASGRTDADARDEAVTLRTVTNVAWGLAGAFTITGVVLVATSYTQDDVPTTAGLCVGPARLSFCGAF
ncbi:MAG: tetratricopeptide repeat protein [Polyangiaceae bacterium]|nr:tetratricopeptide repeat protein [Polyangiaceae bacterium]